MLKQFVRGFIRTFQKIEYWAHTEETKNSDKKENIFIDSVWNYLEIRPNTQAFHLEKIVGSSEWVPMDEILRRIEELYGIRYKNKKSLYPYIKTLVDINLFETSDFGGKRKWRKKEGLIDLKKRKEEIKQKKKEKVQIER